MIDENFYRGTFVRLCHPQRVLPHARVLVHFDCHICLAPLGEDRFGRGVVLLVHGSTRLCQPHLGLGGAVVVFGNAQGALPVLLVDVHINGLLGLLGVDELGLGLLEAALVFENHSQK